MKAKLTSSLSLNRWVERRIEAALVEVRRREAEEENERLAAAMGLILDGPAPPRGPGKQE